jgi:hypothetical protein
MGFTDVIRKSVLEGFAAKDISSIKIVVTLGICFLVAAYIYFVYRYITRTTFYDRNFNVSMAMVSVVTAGIILAMQTSLIISLGMVGALSIVRFRTAIKEPMDMLFLFWSIGTGIICGAGLYELAIIIALIVTFGILLLQIVPVSASPYLVVVNAKDKNVETDILATVKKYSPRYRIDSKNIRISGIDLIIEIRSKNAGELVDELSAIKGITSVSLLYHDAPVKN